jgi:hypothetical protein
VLSRSCPPVPLRRNQRIINSPSKRSYATIRMFVHMRRLYFIAFAGMAAGPVAAITAPDPFGLSLDIGLIAMIFGAIGVGILVVKWLLGPGSSLRGGLGMALGAILSLVIILLGTLWFDYHLLVFRRPTIEGWRMDLAFLKHSLETLPGGLRMRADSCAVPQLDSLEHDLPALTNDQRQVRLIRAIACLNDGHSVDFPFFPATDFDLVPLRIRMFEDGWFVTGASSQESGLIAARVIRINGLEVDDAYRSMRPYVSADNDGSARERAALYMLSPRLWKAIGVDLADGLLTLEIEDAVNGRRTVKLAPAARLRYLLWHLRLREWLLQPAPSPGSPPSAEHRREPWWLKSLPKHRAIYVALRAIENRHEENLDSFAKRLLETAEAMKAERIVIDVRENGGGDNTLFDGFIAALASSRYNSPGRLFVLIDATTFSAATNFVTSMERRTKTVLVGSPTGSGPNHYGDAKMIVLPQTHIAIQLATRFHQFGDSPDMRTAHDPQLRVPLTAGDYFSGRDPVLEAALRYLGP